LDIEIICKKPKFIKTFVYYLKINLKAVSPIADIASVSESIYVGEITGFTVDTITTTSCVSIQTRKA
jgi:hypothetical protein